MDDDFNNNNSLVGDDTDFGTDDALDDLDLDDPEKLPIDTEDSYDPEDSFH